MSEEKTISETKKGETEESKEEKPKKKKDASKTAESKQPKTEKKEVYFIIYYQRKKKEDPKELVFSEDCKSIPKAILTKEVKTSTNKYSYKKVYKYLYKGGKKGVELIFFFGQEEDKYIITFDVKDNIFIYDVELNKGHKFLDNIPKENIDQKIMKYQDKLDLFLEALKQNKEEKQNELLYQETISLYSSKSNFSFLISLFAKIYQEKKLCESLLQKFYDMNIKILEEEKKNIKEKGKKKEKKKENNPNSDREEYLGDQFNSLMVKIANESESLITTNEYNRTQFYGLLLCYLNFYDYTTFENCVNKLNSERHKILYDIFLVYFSQFFKPAKSDESDKEFYIKFFEYIIEEKEFSDFMIGLRFISEIYTFIKVIDDTKEKIFNKYITNNKNNSSFEMIELKDSLKLKKEEIDKIIQGIESINNESKKNNNLLIYFKSDFWKSLLKDFNRADPYCFGICLKLRNHFIEYSKIINTICDKEKDKDTIKDINDFNKIDEFAYLLNENIKRFLKEKKGKLKNSEILGYIEGYNPYYKEPEYKYRREAYILDDLVFEYDIYSIDEDVIKDHQKFIDTFKKLEYEEIFKDNMVKFIDTMVNKINDISSFDTVIDLITVEKIKVKIREYLDKLKNKYELVVKPEIEKLSDEKIKRPIEIIAKFEKLLFEQENNIIFLQENIKKLKICPLIYNQLMIICKDNKYKPMKTFIYEQFLNNIQNIDSIIALIDSLGKEDKKNFLSDLMK